MSNTVLFWFRQDLRLCDHPGLLAASAEGRIVVPVYILDDEAAGVWRPGGASRWWLHRSLEALGESIAEQGGRLLFARGDTHTALLELCEATGADAVYCTRRYEPWAATQERTLHESLGTDGIAFRRFGGSLLFEPGEILNGSGDPYRVFTPFWRACRSKLVAPAPGARTAEVRWHRKPPRGLELDDLEMYSGSPDWAADWPSLWKPGEEGAWARLSAFIEGGLGRYRDGRDLPAEAATSRLSAHLHHGEISVRRVCERVGTTVAGNSKLREHADKFLAELGWREFCHHLLHFFPTLPERPFRGQFDGFPWASDPAAVQAWKRGKTGYPLVDAGMRELWQTGYMHNRVRMVVASFLTKHLLSHWRTGEDWFWDTLVDADLANNSASWQWAAGSGADAAPYFRIFNPVSQGEKFDSSGDYVRRWVPELAALSDRHLHAPWAVPPLELEAAGVRLGETYPRPVVEHREARARALAAYDEIKAG